LNVADRDKAKHTKAPTPPNQVNPAFDKIIKYFIRFIESSGLPANSGSLKLEDEPLKLWEEKDMQGLTYI
jgi:hypothetical protein